MLHVVGDGDGDGDDCEDGGSEARLFRRAASSKRALSISSSCGLPAATLKGNKKPLLLIASVCFLDPPNELPCHRAERSGGAGWRGGRGKDTILEREEQDGSVEEEDRAFHKI